MCFKELITTAARKSLHFTAKGHIDRRLKEEEEKLVDGQEVEGRYLTYFLSRAGMPMKSVYSNVTELMLAGVDTVRFCLFVTSLITSVTLALVNPFCGLITLLALRSPARCPGLSMNFLAILRSRHL